MASLISDKKGQIMLLTALLIIIGVIAYTTILNSMVFSANTPSTGLEVSKKNIGELRKTTESEIFNAAKYSNSSDIVIDPNNETQVREYFMNFMDSFNESIKTLYAAQGVSVEIILNNVTFNKTENTMPVKKYFVEKKNQTFDTGSLIIPMDANQTQIMKVYGLVYKTVDETGTSGLNSTRIPVWTILQNAVNSTMPDFYSIINTDNDASGTVGTVQNRLYSGGPFLVDIHDIDETKKQMILAEAANKSIIIHELVSPFYHERSVKMEVPPKIAVYPKNSMGPMPTYYSHGEVPYTAISRTDILKGNLTQFDILTVPHYDMDQGTDHAKVITEIVGWVTNGGVLHAQCLGADTMDDAVENHANSATWYGFIGISQSNMNLVPESAMYINLLDNNTLFNATYSFNSSSVLPLAGLADPGAPYSPLAQASNFNGIFGNTSGLTPAFSLRSSSQVNPSTNILGYSSYANGTALYGDYDSDSIKEPQIMYLEAPYGNGLVTYIAGHDLSERTGNAERVIFETFFTASMRKTQVITVSAKTINVTIKYFDGKVMVEETLLINI